MATKYKYISVAAPTRGLNKRDPGPDLDPRESTSCVNVFFDNGSIKKRFGYGSEIDVFNGVGVQLTSTGSEITEMATHEFNHAESTFAKNLYAFNLSNALLYSPASNAFQVQDLVHQEP